MARIAVLRTCCHRWPRTPVARSIFRFFNSCVARGETFPSTHKASPLISLRLCGSWLKSATRPAALVPNRIIARQRNDQCPVRIHGTNAAALNADRTQWCLRLVIAREDLRETLKIVRVLFGEGLACSGEKRRRIAPNGCERICDNCLMPGRIPGMHEKLVCVLARNTERGKFLPINNSQILGRRICECLLQVLIDIEIRDDIDRSTADR